MFTIDFLKNEGLPARNRVLEVGFFTILSAVSLFAFGLLWIQYFRNSTVLSSLERELALWESKRPDKDPLISGIEKDLKTCNECRFEIASSIGRYTQWTPVLCEFAGTLPPLMLLNELSVIRTVKKDKVTSITDPAKKVDYELIGRTLVSEVYDFTADAGSSTVSNYLELLRGSERLKGVLNEAYIFESDEVECEGADGKKLKVKNYVINSQLRPQEIPGVK